LPQKTVKILKVVLKGPAPPGSVQVKPGHTTLPTIADLHQKKEAIVLITIAVISA
jgi:hypothetical protein